MRYRLGVMQTVRYVMYSFESSEKVVRCLRRLDSGLSQRRCGFDSGTFYVGFTGDRFFRRELERCSVSVIQPVFCAHSLLLLLGQECEGGKLKQRDTVPDIRNRRECWKRKYFVIVLGPPDG